MVAVLSQAIAMGIFVTNKVHTQMAENMTGVSVFRIAVAGVLLSSRVTSLSLLELGLHSMPIISPVAISTRPTPLPLLYPLQLLRLN